jgi:hypothetical protein
VPRAHGDGGQLIPLYALILLVAAGAAVALAYLGRVAVLEAKAQTAADAAALAGAAEGQAGAAELAARNGATLEDFTVNGTTVEVEVRLGDRHAVARASRS